MKEEILADKVKNFSVLCDKPDNWYEENDVMKNGWAKVVISNDCYY